MVDPGIGGKELDSEEFTTDPTYDGKTLENDQMDFHDLGMPLPQTEILSEP